jgi:putative tricarboxylic transport membrane protein
VLRGAGFQIAPLILALVIGPMIENSLRQGLNIAGGNLWTVLTRPISLALYILTIVVFTVPPIIKQLKKFRA